MKDFIEEWRDIPGFPGYQASSRGRVKSLDRVKICGDGKGGRQRRRYRGMYLKAHTDQDGYYRLNLGAGMTVFCHRVVWMAFNKKNIPKNKQINHKNGNKEDNTPENLELCTVRENIQHAQRTGLRKRLTEQDIRTILFFHVRRSGCNYILAKIFNVTPNTVSAIGCRNYRASEAARRALKNYCILESKFLRVDCQAPISPQFPEFLQST